jgi:hypothetical protein
MSHRDFKIEQDAERRAGTQAFIVFGLLTLAHFIVNATTNIMEDQNAGLIVDPAIDWFIEGTSTIYILALFFAVRWWEARFPIGLSNWAQAVPAHLLGALAFSFVHVLAMGYTREALFPLLFDGNYRFFDSPVRVFIYELRKDLITYIGVLLAIVGFRTIEFHRMEAEAARTEARISHRVTLKCGGRVMHLEAEQFVLAKAAGNYVEAKFGDARHLARMTLADLEKLLTDADIDAARVHRSWLVNKACITQTEPTGEGDILITLTTGETLPGSRRYRDRLEAA